MARNKTGDVVIKSKSENEYTLRLHVEEGKRYYIVQKVEPGILEARTKLEVTGEEEGQKYLSQCTAPKVLRSNKNGYEMFSAF